MEDQHAPRSIDAVIEHFEDALLHACPIKPSMQLGVSDVSVTTDDSGDFVQIDIDLLLPDGSVLTVEVPGHPYGEGDGNDLPEMVERLQRYTNLSPAAVRRRLRKAGFLKTLQAGELEEE